MSTLFYFSNRKDVINISIQKPFNLQPNGQIRDATEDIRFSWQVSGSIQYAIAMVIKDNDTDETEFTLAKTSMFPMSYLLDGETLDNEKTYKWQITVYDEADNSQTSDPIIFSTSARPTVTLTAPTSTVEDQTFTFTANYAHSGSVPMTSWVAYLYDSEQTLINNSGIQTSSTISHVFGGLQSGESYYIEISATAANGLVGTTGKVQFNVQYDQPTIQADLTAENNDDCGIKLQWTVVQIIGDSENTSYVENEEIDATSGRVWFNEGFSIDGDFTLELWLRSVTNQDFDIDLDMDIISSATEPLDQDAVWLEDSEQVGEQSLTLFNSPTQPVSTSVIWLQDTNALSQTTLQLNADLIQPDDINVAWLDLGGNLDDLTLLNLTEDDEVISLKYYNEAFHLYSGYTLIDSLDISGSSYYIYIQRISGVLSFGGEVTA